METLKMIVVGQQRASCAIDATDSAVMQLGAGTAEVKRGLQGIIEASRSRRKLSKKDGAPNGRCESCKFFPNLTGNCTCDTTKHPKNMFLPQLSNSFRQLFSAGDKSKQQADLLLPTQSISSSAKLPEASKTSSTVIPAGSHLGPAQELRERLTGSDAAVALKISYIKDSDFRFGASGSADSAGAVVAPFFLIFKFFSSLN